MGKQGMCKPLHQVQSGGDQEVKLRNLQMKTRNQDGISSCNRLQQLIRDAGDTDLSCLSSI